MLYVDRRDAGQQLAARLAESDATNAVVLGVPRGGVPVALPVAQALGAPLDVIVVRKLGVPHQPEIGMGAVGEDGVRVIDRDMVRAARVTAEELAAVAAREQAEVVARAERFRGALAPIALEGRIAILVDDGIATGSTMLAACQVARARGAGRIAVAVPVASHSALRRVGRVADEVVCLDTPSPFWSVGQWYEDFTQVTDADVTALLSTAGRPVSAAARERVTAQAPLGRQP